MTTEDSRYLVPMEGYRDPKGCLHTMIATILAVVLTVILCLCFQSCKTVQTQTEYKERTVEVRVRDTVITTQADSASIRALLHCDSAYNVVIDELTSMQGTRIKADIKTHGVSNRVSNRVSNALQIEVDCKEDSMQIVCHMKDSIISNLEKQVQVLSVPRERSGYDQFCSTFFWIVLIIFGLWAAWKICDKIPATKPYTTIIKGFLHIL